MIDGPEDGWWMGVAAAAAATVSFLILHPAIAREWVQLFTGTPAPLPAAPELPKTTPRKTDKGAGFPDALADLSPALLGVCRHTTKGGNERQQVWQIEFRTMDGRHLLETWNLGKYTYGTPEEALDQLKNAILRLLCSSELIPILSQAPPLLVLMSLRRVPWQSNYGNGGSGEESVPPTIRPPNEVRPSSGGSLPKTPGEEAGNESSPQ